MKSIIKKTIIGLFFALLFALLADIVVEIKLNPVPLFALLVLLTAVTMIKNQWIVFALTAVVSAGVSYYDISFAIYCLPAVMLVWSALLCKNDKATPFFTAVVQFCFAASLFFSYINNDTELDLSKVFVSMNKFALVPIVVIAFILLQNYKTESYEDDADEDDDEDDNEDDDDFKEDVVEAIPIVKGKKILMTCAYVWSVVFLLAMAMRFKNTINVTLPWAIAMCYVVSLDEPMLMNAFPALKNLFSFS